MNKPDLDSLFDSFNGLRVLIVGDVMVDNYINGKVERVSPEAPVPVVDVTNIESRLGGAANVALNIKSLGATPIMVSVIGNDKEGQDLKKLLEDQNIYSKGLLMSDSRKTTTKTRVVGNNHQLLRFDHEVKSDLNSVDSFLLEEYFDKEIEGVDVVIFEDYNKGVLHAQNIKSFIDKANKLGIPTIVDPKKNNFLEYQNTTVFKPNLKEIKEGLNLDASFERIVEVEYAISLLESKLRNKMTLVTLSERGVIISNQGNFIQIPAHIRNIADVSGAGDTVVSVAALALAKNAEPNLIAELSNLAGGLVCEKRGVVPINKSELLAEAKKILA